MTQISLIAALDEEGGIGFNNQLLCHLPADLQYFKSVTMGKPIIMGRKTYESIGRPLPGRLNIVLSHKPLLIEGVVVAHSLDAAMELTAQYPEVFIIGGAKIFSQAMNLASRMYITRIHHQFLADVYFPIIDESIWESKNQEFRNKDEKNPFDLTFIRYEKKKPY